MDNLGARRESLLEARGICKAFSKVQVLDHVDFELCSGEVMALMGENGAGKSTLVKIITGVYEKNDGSVFLEGKEIHPHKVTDSQKLGIQTVYQELNLSPFLSVAENLFIGHEIRDKRGFVDWPETWKRAEMLMGEMGLDIDIKTPLNKLTTAMQQMVAIARAVSSKAKVLILDEPTSSLDNKEVEVLFDQIRRLKAIGMGIVYITHRMGEVFEICDRITILRNGRLIGIYDKDELDMSSLISNMIGNDKERADVKRKADNPALPSAPTSYQFHNICKKNKLYNVDLDIKRGEILGIAELLGSGRTELARILYGDDQDYTGEIYINGERTKFETPRMAIQHGIAYCTEDRRHEGIFALMGIDDNIVMRAL